MRTIDAKVAECLHIASVFERGLPTSTSSTTGSTFCRSRTAIRGLRRWLPRSTGSRPYRIVPVYQRYDNTAAYVSISDADRHPNLHYAATIHHGIDIDEFCDPIRARASICCSSVGSTPTRAPLRRSRSPADVAAGSIPVRKILTPQVRMVFSATFAGRPHRSTARPRQQRGRGTRAWLCHLLAESSHALAGRLTVSAGSGSGEAIGSVAADGSAKRTGAATAAVLARWG